MAEPGQEPRSGARDNGLRCAGYTPIGDVDPRVADAMLETLRGEGIAAYITPTPAARGGYLELELPSRPTDRLYVDSGQADRAGVLLAGELQHATDTVAQESAAQPGPAPDTDADPTEQIDFESAWQQVLGSLQSGPSSPVAPWPVSEDLDSRTVHVPIALPPSSPDDLAGDPTGGDPALEEHFVPPPPPPLPRLRRTTVVALLSIVAGLVVLATQFDGGDLTWLAILAILGGGATLVWQVKEGPPTDSGWDDGAVV